MTARWPFRQAIFHETRKDRMANQGRKLIVCCDGTWNKRDSENAPTNVAKIARAIKPVDSAGVAQLIYYHPGVGTGDWLDQFIGGAFGVGLSGNVQSAYAFLADNYRNGDAVYVFGFSRGAFTVRSLVGLIERFGILNKRDMEHFPKMYEIYRSRSLRDMVMSSADLQLAESALDKLFPGWNNRKLLRAVHESRAPDIFFVGVWDTVGSLGIPLGFLRWIAASRFTFHDTELREGVTFAYQALAMDESRYFFQPSLWKRNRGRGEDKDAVPQVLEQVWFAGVHSNVGGGYNDAGLSDIAFLWMAGKAAEAIPDDHEGRALEFEESYLTTKVDARMGELIKSRKSWSPLKYVRPIFVPPSKGQDGAEKETCERIHESVLLRFKCSDSGLFDPFPYAPVNAQQLLERPAADKIAKLSAFEKKYRRWDDMPGVGIAP
jgi:uncharacterized protein (DUF2235 family)